MKRWDRLVDGYMEEYRARGVGEATINHTGARLDRWGLWLKQRRPRVPIERIDADLITRYMASCSSFRAKATVYGTLSTMRSFGDFLVRQQLCTTTNPEAAISQVTSGPKKAIRSRRRMKNRARL